MRTTTSCVLLLGGLLGACTDEEPKSIAKNPTALAAVGQDLAWRTDAGGVRLYSIEGGTIGFSGARGSDPTGPCDGDLRVVGDTMYWTDCAHEVRFARNGDVPFGGFTSGWTNIVTSMAFAVDGARVYSGVDIVYSHPLVGGTNVSGLGDALTTKPFVVESLALDGGELYVGAGTPFTGDLDNFELVGGIYRVTSGVLGQERVLPWNDDVIFNLVAGEGTLAWSTRYNTYRANLDGTKIALVGTAANRGLQIAHGRIWWTDTADDVVSTALDGSDRRVHYHGASRLVGPALIGDTAYVLESDAERIDQDRLYGPDTYHLVTIDL